MRGRSIGRLIEGVMEGDPLSLLIVGGLVVALLAWGISVGRRRRREQAEREKE
jgi:hypothetical protein